jgi:hypothetical protein
VEDAYGNAVTGDNTDKVTLTLQGGAGGTLSGTNPVTVSGGVATFSNLSVNTQGSGYALSAASGSLKGITSASFNVTSPSTTIEDFENSDNWNLVGSNYLDAYMAPWAAHDGNYGLDQPVSNEWMYRSDAGAKVKAGDTLSVWLQFSAVADGRAYFGFGASASGTLSLVAAPNTGQLILQKNISYGFTNLAAVNYSNYQPDQWYRLEVDWGKSGTIVGKLFDSDGVTLLASVQAKTTAITSGGIAFRATGTSGSGDDKYWDTVTATYGVNAFTTRTVGHATTPFGGVVFTTPAMPAAPGPQGSGGQTLQTVGAPVPGSFGYFAPVWPGTGNGTQSTQTAAPPAWGEEWTQVLWTL